MIPLDRLRREAQLATEVEFLARYPFPAIVCHRIGGDDPPDGERPPAGRTTRTIRLRNGQSESWLTKTSAFALESRRETADNTQVAFVTKRAGSKSLFPNMVTVGRMASNDIHLPYPTVSKVHAVILRGGEGQWFVQDQRSANGTWLHKQRLERGQKVQLEDGAWIGCGPEVALEFLLPPSLYAWLRALGSDEAQPSASA